MKSRLLKQFDWLLLVTVAFLIAFGLAGIYSASFEGGTATLLNFEKQMISAGIGVGLLFALTFIDYRVFKNYARLLYAITIILLLAVLILTDPVRGARSWFDLGFFQFQPSEFAKVFMIIFLGRYFAEHRNEMYRFRHILVSGIYVAIPTILIMLQPDLGSALVIIVLWIGLILISGIRPIYAALIGAGSIIAAAVSWLYLLKDYQKERLMVFLDPSADPLGSGYNVIQSIIAIGSGNWFGRGFAQGSQSQLNFLPEQHTDFIFAVIAEEFGLIGTAILLALMAILLIRIIRAARKSRDHFGMIIAIGVALILGFQILISVGMNMGIMPVTGIPLPFVSYGGSTMVAMLLLIGLVQSIVSRNKKLTFD